MQAQVVQLESPSSIAAADNFSFDPDLILAFLPPDEQLIERLELLANAWPNAQLAGATALQQFTTEGLASHGVLLGLAFEHSEHSAWCETVGLSEDGAPDLTQAMQQFEAVKPDMVILLCDGVHFPVFSLLEMLREVACLRDIPIVGGLASKDPDPKQFMLDNGAWVFSGANIDKASALMIGLCGVEANIQIARGWEPASPVYEVTEAEGNLARRIEQMSAADWYRSFFTVNGELAPLPSAAYGFPLIIDSDQPERKLVYRSLTVFDDPPGCVAFAGDIRTGDRVRLGIGDADSLVQASAGMQMHSADVCLLFSCVAREVVLGDAAQDEILALSPLLDGTPLVGFFTFGEIGPSEQGALAYYNQTGVLALLTERTT